MHKILPLFLIAQLSFATTYEIPAQGNVVGEVQYANPEIGETLAEVGIRYDIGFNEMVKANPGVNPHQVLSSQIKLVIPSQFTLPNVARQGIVINLAQYRLYFYPPDDNVVMTYPVGIGRKGWNTPTGLTKVISKERSPVWRPSTKLRKEAAESGMILPETFPSSVANPLGKYALRLGWSSYLIHGSNRTDSIGMRVSAGCIRMLPDDIEYLFEFVKVNTRVNIINA